MEETILGRYCDLSSKTHASPVRQPCVQKQACAGHGGFGCSKHTAGGGDKPTGSAEADIAAPLLHRAVSSTAEIRLQRSIVISPQLLQGVRYVSCASRTTWRFWYVVCRLEKVGQPESLPSLS